MIRGLLVAACLAMSAGDFAFAQTGPVSTGLEAEAAEDILIAALAEPWRGDLEGIVERGYLRVGLALNPIHFSYDGADQRGLAVDAMRELEAHLRETVGSRTLTVALAPLPRDRMIDALVEGRVDMLAANLTITPEREAAVAFTDPLADGVSEIVVTGTAAPSVEDFDDLVAVGVHVRRSSSYFEHLQALNAARVEAGGEPIPVHEADENLEDYDLLQLVAAGVIPAGVVDDHKATLWAQILEELQLHTDLTVADEGRIAWAIRKESPALMDALNGFVKTAKQGTLLGNVLIKRYYEDVEPVRNATAPGENEKLDAVIEIIERHAGEYDFDTLLIAAQGYQESGLDQSKRSKAGAVGVMQVMPATARDPNVAIPDIHLVDRNVEAGVKYLRFLRDRYFSEGGMTPLDRALFSFAAYNAGPANIAKARRRAERMGLDPDVWFGNVELAAARTVSREPVVYVRNILKYYVTYRLYEARRQE